MFLSFFLILTQYTIIVEIFWLIPLDNQFVFYFKHYWIGKMWLKTFFSLNCSVIWLPSASTECFHSPCFDRKQLTAVCQHFHKMQIVWKNCSSTTVSEIIKVRFNIDMSCLFSSQNIRNFSVDCNYTRVMHISKLLELVLYNLFCWICAYSITLFWIIFCLFAINVFLVLF